jgi:hypothetical protein
MSASPAYSFIADCSLRKIGEHALLLVFPRDGSEAFGLQVNESFALLFEAVSGLESFSAGDLAGVLVREYGLAEPEALEEAGRTIALWIENGLIG